MTSIISWNIQCGLGVDGRVDLQRIADVINQMGGADVICLQEVARFFPDLDRGQGADQVAVLKKCFPGFAAMFGPALDRPSPGNARRQQFGNLILSRLPVLQTFRHSLPQPLPADPVQHMPRQALEVVVAAPDGPLRVTTTHLEYHSARQRLHQAERLCALTAEIVDNLEYAGYAPADGPYAAIPRPGRSVLCGDFNAEPDDSVYQRLTHRDLDAWRQLHGVRAHAPTCGIHDRIQWPQGPHARDFFFVSPELKSQVLAVEVETDTDASDHQPLRLLLNTDGGQIG